MTVYCQAELIIPAPEFAPHDKLPVIVKRTTIPQSVHIINLRIIFNSAFFSYPDITYLFYLNSWLSSLFSLMLQE